MAVLGAHMSIAGGYYKAVEAAADLGMDCVQVFTKNNNQWRAKEITAAEADRFQQALRERNLSRPIAHASYLINLGTPDELLWNKSIDGMVVEIERATQLGIPGVVVHPGAHTTSTPEEGLAAIARAIDVIHRRVPLSSAKIVLENTAGQGSCLGARFEDFAVILAAVAEPERIGICLDTCHAFAAGYALSPKADYLATMKEFDHLVGIERLQAFHLNDSKRERGSRVDRHEHIGRGKIGLEAFELLLNDRRFRDTPMYLETPKEGACDGEPWDAANLRVLRDLCVKKSPRATSRRTTRS